MAWTTPRTWVAAETVDEDHLNEQIRDNTVYLKAETDKLDDVSQTQPGNSIGTIYQNGAKIRFVQVCVACDDNDQATVQVGSATPPTTIVAIGLTTATGGEVYANISFIVLPNYYYRIVAISGSPTLKYWTEWDLH